jgi:ADP-dependent NAD(P)H-hydrate dehydratase / NAD(P)H-hydrate epimerase
MFEVKKSILKDIYKKRDLWSRKYDFGHLLVIGGSKQYSGSPAFNALAALRSGVDLVTVISPERAANIVASFSPDMIAYPLQGDYLNKSHLGELKKFTERKNVVVIGGGLGRETETMETILEYLKEINIPCVIDADAIHAVATNKEVLKGKKFVITPHSQEFKVLTGIELNTDVKDRIIAVKESAMNLGTTILLKGHVDVISNGTETAINNYGSPYMSKGGCGDTLAGICGALIARGVDPFNAACAAAYINGKAGAIGGKKLRESLTASDLINSIPRAIR